MFLIPCLYLKDSNAVFTDDRGAVHHENPFELVESWGHAGVEWIQINDLNISPTTHSPNEDVIKKIINDLKLKVQLTGNIKTEANISRHLNLGAARIILGSITYQNPEFVKQSCQEHVGKIGAAIDVKDSKVNIPGYIVSANKNALDYAERFRDLGVSFFIHSNVDASGHTTSDNLKQIGSFCQKCHIPVICSNQVNSQEEIAPFLDLERLGLIGINIDKAIYERKVDINSVITYINDRTLSGDDEPTLIPE